MDALGSRDIALDRSFIGRAVDFIFGYDFFVSYAHGDGVEYPRALAQKLSDSGFRVFIDIDAFIPGDELRLATRRAIRRSNSLVVVARPCAMGESQWVQREVEECLKARKRLIVIKFTQSSGVASEAFAAATLDRLHVSESLSADSKAPSAEVIGKLRDSFEAIRQDRLRQIAFAVIGIVLLMTSTVALILARQYGAERDSARAAQRKEQHFRAKAEAAQEHAEASRRDAEYVASSQKGMRASILAEGRMELEPLLLAIEAVAPYSRNEKRAAPPEAYQALFDALSMRAVVAPLVSLDEAATVEHMAFSPDAELLAAAGRDSAVRIYEVGSAVEVRKLEGHTRPVTSVTFTSDGSTIATTSEDGSLRLWETASGDEIRRLETRGEALDTLTLSIEGTLAAAASRDGAVWLWDLASDDDANLLEKGLESRGLSLAFGSETARVFAVSDTGDVRHWDTKSGKMIAKFDPDGRDTIPTAVAFSSDARRLALAESDNTVRIVDTESGADLLVLDGQLHGVSAMDFSPDGAWLASGDGDHGVRIWDTTSGKELFAWQDPVFPIRAVEFASSGRRFASASLESVQIWEIMNSDAFVRELPGHAETVADSSFSPDGTRVATAGWDHSAKIWDVVTGREVVTLLGHDDKVVSVEFSADGAQLASASDDGTVRLWDTSTGNERAKFEDFTASPGGMAFSPNGSYLAFSGPGASVRLVDVETAEPLVSLEGHLAGVRVLAFSPDGTRLATGGHDHTVRLWNVLSGRELANLRAHTNMIQALDFSADGLLLASASMDNTVRLWSTTSLTEVGTMRDHTLPVLRVVFSPNGSDLATAGMDAVVSLWDIETGMRSGRLEGHNGAISAMAFSPDGTYLVTASFDATARLWDVRSGQQLAELDAHTEGLSSLAFSPDGARFVTTAMDGSVIVWPTPEAALRLACTEVAGYAAARRVTAVCEIMHGSSSWGAVARGHLEDAVAWLAASSEAQKRTIWIHLLRGEEASGAGQLGVARREIEMALDIAEVIGGVPGSRRDDRELLCIALDSLGDVEILAGDLGASNAAYQRAFEIRTENAQEDPLNPATQKSVVDSLTRLADVRVRVGDLEVARKLLTGALEFADPLAAAAPHDTSTQLALAKVLSVLGDVEARLASPDVAREHLVRSLEIREKLFAAQPGETDLRRSIVNCLNSLGDIELGQGNVDVARERFELSLQISETIAAAEPLKGEGTRDVSIALNRLGELESVVENYEKAREYFVRSIELKEMLAQHSPQNADAKNDLAFTLNNLAELEVASKDYEAARELYQRTVDLLGDPNQFSNVLALESLVTAHHQLGKIEFGRVDAEEGYHHLQRAIGIQQGLAEANPTNDKLAYQLVLLHVSVVNIAHVFENEKIERMHLNAAEQLLRRMDEAGQISGDPDREFVRDQVYALLAGSRDE